MWVKPWKYKEGIAAGAGLTLTGILLQFALGPIDWGSFAAPANYVATGVFVALILCAHLLRDKVYLFAWLGFSQSAVCSIAFSSLLTIVLGFGVEMLTNWAFALVYIWMVVSLSLAILRVCIPLKAGRIPFLLNHLGLWTALVCGVMGSADLQRLRMTATLDAPQWRAVDAKGEIKELPIAIELKSFGIDEYPPKLMLVDNTSGAPLPKGAAQNIVLEDGITEGTLDGYKVSVLEYMEESAPVIGTDSIRYNTFHSSGCCSSVLVRVSQGSTSVEGWVSCGSYAFPLKSLKINDKVSIVMPEREPRRYVSAVNVYTESGKSISDTIVVNKPCRIDGWKIYQLDYDRNMGRWSERSVFELVRDPWMPAVYVGILMLIAGAVCMFISFGRRKL